MTELITQWKTSEVKLKSSLRGSCCTAPSCRNVQASMYWLRAGQADTELTWPLFLSKAISKVPLDLSCVSEGNLSIKVRVNKLCSERLWFKPAGEVHSNKMLREFKKALPLFQLCMKGWKITTFSSFPNIEPSQGTHSTFYFPITVIFTASESDNYHPLNNSLEVKNKNCPSQPLIHHFTAQRTLTDS